MSTCRHCHQTLSFVILNMYILDVVVRSGRLLTDFDMHFHRWFIQHMILQQVWIPRHFCLAPGGVFTCMRKPDKTAWNVYSFGWLWAFYYNAVLYRYMHNNFMLDIASHKHIFKMRLSSSPVSRLKTIKLLFPVCKK